MLLDSVFDSTKRREAPSQPGILAVVVAKKPLLAVPSHYLLARLDVRGKGSRGAATASRADAHASPDLDLGL